VRGLGLGSPLCGLFSENMVAVSGFFAVRSERRRFSQLRPRVPPHRAVTRLGPQRIEIGCGAHPRHSCRPARRNDLKGSAICFAPRPILSPCFRLWRAAGPPNLLNRSGRGILPNRKLPDRCPPSGRPRLWVPRFHRITHPIRARYQWIWPVFPAVLCRFLLEARHIQSPASRRTPQGPSGSPSARKRVAAKPCG